MPLLLKRGRRKSGMHHDKLPISAAAQGLLPWSGCFRDYLDNLFPSFGTPETLGGGIPGNRYGLCKDWPPGEERLFSDTKLIHIS
jgi:hypothetical protein